MRAGRVVLDGALSGVFLLLPLAAAAGDWPQWGGTDCRNLVSDERELPDAFTPGKKTPNSSGIDLATTQNVRWVARLGSAAYGNPTVAGGRVFVGTDDQLLTGDARLKRSRGGLVQCLDEATGRLLWRLTIPERTDIPPDAHFTHQFLGVCSSPTVDGDRAYVVLCDGQIACLDVRGQANGNDGPFVDEGQFMVPAGNPPVELTDEDADIIWLFDPMKEVGVVVHDAASCSAIVHGDAVYVGTSNGVEVTHKRVVAPEAPSLIVLDKRTGRLVATDGEKIGTRLFHAQWSSPSLGEVNGKTLLFFGGGDGVVYAFETLDKAEGEPVSLKKVWSYDANPPEYKLRDGKSIPYYDGDKRKPNSPNKNDGTYVGPSQLIATPVFHRNRVYIASGQDPAHGRGRGMLHCIDATKTGDVTQTGCLWRYDGIERSLSTVAIADGLLYVPDLSGKLHCLDAETGARHYVFEANSETWGGPLVADGKVYLGTQRAFFILAAGTTPNVLARVTLGSPAYSTPVAANGAVFVTSQRYLWAVETKP
ncbi:MAG: PQQ-binding-like beta-propeller repeat protein [Pirellulales bacterium]|nr:PQQ-binding-like beta-propeller repeat protein [Pirellulales bacterium]